MFFDTCYNVFRHIYEALFKKISDIFHKIYHISAFTFYFMHSKACKKGVSFASFVCDFGTARWSKVSIYSLVLLGISR